jgi:hypothetical protein
MAKVNKKPIVVGNIYGIPVSSGKYFPMLVTCAAGNNYLGYVFPFDSTQLETKLKASNLQPRDSAFHLIFGVPPRSRVEWPVLYSLAGFCDQDWPIPCFAQEDPLLGISWRLYFSRNDLSLWSRREQITPEEAKKLEYTGTLALGGVEARVERLLGNKK